MIVRGPAPGQRRVSSLSRSISKRIDPLVPSTSIRAVREWGVSTRQASKTAVAPLAISATAPNQSSLIVFVRPDGSVVQRRVIEDVGPFIALGHGLGERAVAIGDRYQLGGDHRFAAQAMDLAERQRVHLADEAGAELSQTQRLCHCRLPPLFSPHVRAPA